jgi:hypothetical protein
MSVFVATVVPWMSSAVLANSSSGVQSYAVATSRKPVSTPSDGS